MKTIKLSLLLSFGTTLIFAQNYEQIMSNSIMEMYKTDDISTYDKLANKFSRIAQAEPGKWEPRYYEALAHVFKSWGVKDFSAKDEVLGQAHLALKAATSIDSNNSEILALQGFVDMMKVSVDPATRGQTLTPKIMTAFGRAIAIDPSNPRAALFMAQMQIGTAQFFGTPIDQPCALVERASELFNNAEPTSALTPMWGAQSVAEYQQICLASAKSKQ